jgi:uridine phosphorylase
LVNIDFGSRTPKPASKSLTIVRLGTSGAIRPEIEVDSILLSRYAIGLDGLMHFYKISPTIAEEVICEECIYKLENIPHIRPYVTSSDEMLHQAFSALGSSGITITSSGFYGPQGRTLRKPIADVKFIDAMSHIKYGDTFATNLEMETAGIYGMSTMLGHHAISINAILANRSKQIFSKNPSATVSKLIEKALPIIESI